MFEFNAAVPRLGFDPVDQDHRAFFELLEVVNQSDKAAFAERFAQLLALTEAHFDQENALMDQSGFAGTAEHQAEHARLLSEMRQVYQRVAGGRQMMGRAYARERLPQWFSQHIGSMDSMLVAHLLQT